MAMIRPAREIEMKVPESGDLVIRDLKPGSMVRVQVFPQAAASSHDPTPNVLAKYRGCLINYDRPFDPVENPDDWDAEVEPRT